MNWNDFFSELSGGSVRPAYLFTGAEDYVKREALQKLRAAILPAGLEALNENMMEGADALKIVEAAETLPVMCDRRLVVVRDWAPLMSGKSRDEENEVKRMLDYLDRGNRECTLVFYMRGEAEPKKKLTTELRNRGLAVEFDPLSDADAVRWIVSHFKTAKKKISQDNARQLLFIAGHDLTRLDGEIAKLAAYAGSRAEIDAADLEAVVSPSLEFGAFDMLNHLFDGDIPGAYRTLNLMLERGSNRVAILSSLARQLRGMAFLGIASENSDSTETTGKMLGLKPYPAKLMAQQARKYASADLEKLYRDALDADYAIKSGRVRDSAALDRLFLQISSVPTKNRQPNRPGGRLSH